MTSGNLEHEVVTHMPLLCGAHADHDPGRRRCLVYLVGATGAVVLAGCSSTEVADRLGGIAMISPSEERDMGEAAWSDITSELKRSKDARANQRLETVGRRIVEAGGNLEENWEFALFEDPAANAFALPGGKVGFYTGILERMDNDAQLAAVMGHEVGHVNARHGAKRMSTQRATAFGLQALQVALQLGDVAMAGEIAGALGAGVVYGVIMPYSRAHELEADELGVRYMARAGYDPQESVRFWDNMRSQSEGGRPPEFLSTHPAEDRRIRELRRIIPEVQPVYEENRLAQRDLWRLVARLTR